MSKTVSFIGNFTQKEAIDFKDHLLSEIQSGHNHLVVNLYEVKESDIVGVNALAVAHKAINNLDGKLEILVNKNSSISHLLHVTKFSKVFNISYA